MQNLFNRLSHILNNTLDNEDNNKLNVQQPDIKTYKQLCVTYNDQNNDSEIFKENIKKYIVYGNAIIQGQIAHFSKQQAVIILTSNKIDTINQVELNSSIISNSELGESIEFKYNIYENYMCYHILIQKPSFQPFEKIKFHISCRIPPELQYTQEKFPQEHGVYFNEKHSKKDIKYYLKIFFYKNNQYTKKPSIYLQKNQISKWKIQNSLYNYQFKYINLKGRNDILYINNNYQNTQYISLPFICDENKIKEVLEYFKQKTHNILFETLIKINMNDIISIEIGFIKIICCIEYINIILTKKNIYKHQIMGNIISLNICK